MPLSEGRFRAEFVAKWPFSGDLSGLAATRVMSSLRAAASATPRSRLYAALGQWPDQAMRLRSLRYLMVIRWGRKVRSAASRARTPTAAPRRMAQGGRRRNLGRWATKPRSLPRSGMRDCAVRSISTLDMRKQDLGQNPETATRI